MKMDNETTSPNLPLEQSEKLKKERDELREQIRGPAYIVNIHSYTILSLLDALDRCEGALEMAETIIHNEFCTQETCHGNHKAFSALRGEK